MKTRQSFKLIVIIIFFSKAEGENLFPRENEKKQEMGFARRKVEIKYKTQGNQFNKKENKKRTHFFKKKNL